MVGDWAYLVPLKSSCHLCAFIGASDTNHWLRDRGGSGDGSVVGFSCTVTRTVTQTYSVHPPLRLFDVFLISGILSLVGG